MIKVTASGNIGKDAEVRTINDNSSVTTFSIASTKKVKGEDKTTWLNCQKWNSDKLAPYLKKGTKVILSGDLEIRENEGKYYTTLNVWDLEFGSKPQTNNEQSEASEPQKEDGGNDLPF
jgi:single-strand DNA-binding protein